MQSFSSCAFSILVGEGLGGRKVMGKAEKPCLSSKSLSISSPLTFPHAKIWNRMRPWALELNQHTRELISTQNTEHKYNRPESPMVTLTWHACKYKVYDIYIYTEDVPLVEFTHVPCESYRRRLRSLLLYLCYIFWALINSHVCRCSTCSSPCRKHLQLNPFHHRQWPALFPVQVFETLLFTFPK